MIWLLSFLGVGTVGHALCGALGARLAPAHVLPDACVVIAVFISMRRDPFILAVAASLLGTLAARDSLAPAGLHPLALLITAIGSYLLAGSLAGSGSLFFGMSCAVATVVYQALLYLLLLLQGSRANFASWAAATLVLGGLCTGALGLLCEPLLRRLDQVLSPKRPTGLLWRS